MASLGAKRWAAAMITAATGIVAAIGFAGCGASSVVDPVAQAATSSTGAPGYRMAFSAQVSSPALPMPVTSTGTGSFDTRDHLGEMVLNMSLPGAQAAKALGSNSIQLKELMAGTILYMKMPSVIASRLPGAKPWWKLNLAQAAAAQGIPGLSSLTNGPTGSNPAEMLQYLRGASGGLTKVGGATVNGIPTTHYRGQIKLDRVPDQVPAASRASVRQSITAIENLTHLHQIPVDVWVDSHHLVRRMRMTYGVSVQGHSLQMTMATNFLSYGPQPKPSLPPAAQTADLNALIASHGG
jgi:hypothetical protein